MGLDIDRPKAAQAGKFYQ